jgi:hypothetical protein
MSLKTGYFGKKMRSTLKDGRMDKLSWTNRVKNEILRRDKEAKSSYKQ